MYDPNWGPDVQIDTPQKWCIVKNARKIILDRYADGKMPYGLTWSTFLDRISLNLVTQCGLSFSCQHLLESEDPIDAAGWTSSQVPTLADVQDYGEHWLKLWKFTVEAGNPPDADQ